MNSRMAQRSPVRKKGITKKWQKLTELNKGPNTVYCNQLIIFCQLNNDI